MQEDVAGQYLDASTTMTLGEYKRREAAGTLKRPGRVTFRRQVTDLAADAKKIGHIDEPKVYDDGED